MQKYKRKKMKIYNYTNEKAYICLVKYSYRHKLPHTE